MQGSYGYRGRHGYAHAASTGFVMGMVETRPGRVFGCDFYEPFFAPPRIHHKSHINVLRASGQVEQLDMLVSFGPTDADIQAALDALDHHGGTPPEHDGATAGARGRHRSSAEERRAGQHDSAR